MIERGGIHWMDFGPPVGSRPAKRRPALVLQSDQYNRTPIRSVLVATLTTNLELADLPGNVFVPADAAGLARDSVVTVTSVASVDRHELGERIGTLPFDIMRQVDAGLRLVLGL